MPPLPVLLRQLLSSNCSSIYATISIATRGPLGLSLRREGAERGILGFAVQRRELFGGRYGEDAREGCIPTTRGREVGCDGNRLSSEIEEMGAMKSVGRWPGKRPMLGGARNVSPLPTTISTYLRYFATLPNPKPNQKPPSPPSAHTSPSPPPPKPPLKRLLSLPHENIYTLPNILTFSRLLAAPLIGYLVLHDAHAWAIGLFAYAGITDLVDGWIARRWNLQTVVGTVVDPMADKTLMTVVTVCLAVKGLLPVWLATIILGRDVLLAISAIYYRYISLPPPKTFARYWDFSLPSAEVHPTGISKVNTALQLGLLGWTVGMPLLGHVEGLGVALVGMQYLVATTTIWSGASYIYTKDAVKILTPKEVEEKSGTSGKGERTAEKKADR